MVDKKDTKIRAIHKGIQLPTEEVEIDLHLVSVIESLLEHVKSGRITEVCYTGVGNKMDSVRGMAGVSKYPFLLSKQLETLNMLYNEEVIYPILLSPDHYEDTED